MSRKGKKPVSIPSGVEVKVTDSEVKVRGPKGSLSEAIPAGISVDVDDEKVAVSRASDDRDTRCLHGLIRSLINNMVIGVTEGYKKTLVVRGTGYRASLSGDKLVLSVGFSHPVEITPPEGIEVECPSRTRIVVSGIDKQLVGEIAAKIRLVRPPEPYHGYGIRYEGEHVRRKEGKSAVVTTT